MWWLWLSRILSETMNISSQNGLSFYIDYYFLLITFLLLSIDYFILITTFILYSLLLKSIYAIQEMFYSLEAILKRVLDVDHLMSLCVQIPKYESLKTAENKISQVSNGAHTYLMGQFGE